MSDLVIRVRDGEKAKELARSLKQKVPDLACPACGKRDFGLLEQPDAGVRTWLSREDQPFAVIGVKKSQPLVTLVCTNCGHVEQFAEVILGNTDPSPYGEDIDRE
jgi:transcription elongation factor Elf1